MYECINSFAGTGIKRIPSRLSSTGLRVCEFNSAAFILGSVSTDTHADNCLARHEAGVGLQLKLGSQIVCEAPRAGANMLDSGLKLSPRRAASIRCPWCLPGVRLGESLEAWLNIMPTYGNFLGVAFFSSTRSTPSVPVTS